MINIYKTMDGSVKPVDEMEENSWISLVNPTFEEMQHVSESLEVELEFIRAALDEEETSRIESEDGHTLIIVDVPYANNDDQNLVTYETIPLGIVITKDHIITTCLKDVLILKDMYNGTVKQVNTHMKTRFILQLLYRVATRYLLYLKQIDRMSGRVEKELHQSMKNKELIQLLDLEKSLVYFTTSLRANEVTLEKFQRGRYTKMYEEDQDLLEDVLIEIKQAIEMSNIYSNILSGTMDAFASIISNNLNIVMKVLTIITILMAIPTMIASFFGMNVTHIPMGNFWYVLIFSVLLTVVLGFVLYKKKLF